MDAEEFRDPRRNLFSDRGVPAVEEVVHPGLGDAGLPGQCPHAERASGGSLHELAEQVAVGEFKALFGHGSPCGLSTFVDVDS